jgi:acetyl esterase/lipase
MESVSPRDDVTFAADALGGIPGIWVHAANCRPDEAILHLHGGWFNFGSANAYRHLVGHIAARAGARAFIPDYRLAPEHPFPAATDDVLACYRGLAGNGVRRIALTGDSAGGNLALASPLHSQLAGIPPVRIHVGDDEVLLDDSLRYAERAVAAGVDAGVDVWMGMPHGFPGSIGKLKAAALALNAVGAFLTERLQAHASP